MLSHMLPVIARVCCRVSLLADHVLGSGGEKE